MAIIECIPNISEGRRQDVLDACAHAIREAGARLLDVKADASHNRTVYTFAGDPATVQAAVLRALRAGAAGASTCDTTPASTRAWAPSTSCRSSRSKARRWPTAWRSRETVGAEVARRHGCRCFCTKRRRRRRRRRNLEDIRRGEFEGLAAKTAAARMGAGFRARRAASVGRRVGHRRAHAAHRLQRQPGHQPARRRARRSPRPSGRAPAGCASSRRWASSWPTAASCRCR